MNVTQFINNFKEAFGEHVELPIAFWYTDFPVSEPEKINGCLFKIFTDVRRGICRTVDADTIGCGSGKFYTGFIPMPVHVPKFVSIKEKYKQTPELVTGFLADFDVPPASKPYLNFVRIDALDSFDSIEGLIFFVLPDVLSGLASWTYFDNNRDDAVSSIFGSGCSATISVAVRENLCNGRRTFLGGFDPSVRPYINPYEFTFTIPINRFREMYETMRSSCLYDTHGWEKVRQRIRQEYKKVRTNIEDEIKEVE